MTRTYFLSPGPRKAASQPGRRCSAPPLPLSAAAVLVRRHRTPAQNGERTNAGVMTANLFRGGEGVVAVEGVWERFESRRRISLPPE